jgi:hypothetical protein
VGRGGYTLARVAVLVREPGRWMWWLGLAGAVVGLEVPGFTGRRIGLLAGAVLFLLAVVAAALVRRGRYRKLGSNAQRASRAVTLQDRRTTIRLWRRAHRWWLPAAFVACAGSCFLAASAGGMLLAGVGAGLWAKAIWLGQWEREHDVLLWVRPEWATRGPAAKSVPNYQTTGPAAGDAAPGGAPRKTLALRP